MIQRGPTTTQKATPRVWLWPDGTKPPMDVGRWCSAFSYSKALAQPTGQWSCTLQPYQGARNMAHIGRLPDLASLVRPNSLISLGMDEDGGICLGLVDQCTRTGRSGATLTYELTGTDMGKLLTTDHIMNASVVPDVAGTSFLSDLERVVGPDNSLLHQFRAKWGPTSGAAGETGFYGADLADVIAWVITKGPAAMQVPLLEAWGGVGRTGSIINTSGSITTWNLAKIFGTGVQDFQGTVWGFIQAILDADFYECILDSAPNSRNLFGKVPQINLTIRPKPFDSIWMSRGPHFLPVTEAAPIGLTWETLRTRIDGAEHWSIPRSQILDEHLGISDADVMSYYCVTADHDLLNSPAAAAQGLFYPAVDLFALQRSGLRAYQGRMSLATSQVVDPTQAQPSQEYIARGDAENYRNRLFNWYRLAEYFESGTIQVPGQDRFRVGDPVYLPDHRHMRSDLPVNGVRFYCTSTTHSWSAGAPYTTTLQLQRGHNLSAILKATADIDAAGKSVGVVGMFTVP